MANNVNPMGRPRKSEQEKALRWLKRAVPDSRRQAIYNQLFDDCHSVKASIRLKALAIYFKSVEPYFLGKPEQQHNHSGSIEHDTQISVYLPANGREVAPLRNQVIGYLENGIGNGAN